jgi:pimeloyl-ACP methyl ester carboxylesterase
MDLLMVKRADSRDKPDSGTVVLLHGISANRVIMKYLARSFAELGLSVYVPDLPGHGRSPGPFTAEKAQTCAGSLVRGLAARGMIVPERTVLAGHSMGGAIALRVAQNFRPAGVIAISPAPMQEAHGVIHENLLFHDAPRVVPNTLILAGQFEPTGLTSNAADLATHSGDASVQFRRIPQNSHVSMLFSPTVAREAQEWAARVLSLAGAKTGFTSNDEAQLPSRANFVGCLMGLAGLLLLAGPFLRELTGKEPCEEERAAKQVGWLRGAVEIAVLSVFAVHALHYWRPLSAVYLFEGDYLASFFLIVGVGLILLHHQQARGQFPAPGGLLLGAAIGAFLLHFLITGWFELTATGAWLTLPRWERFPLFFCTVFAFLYGVELLAGPVANRRGHYGCWVLLIVLAWLALVFGVLYLKSGEILLVLLSPYFALQILLMGLGAQLVRRQTGSATAAALFGAILLTGFCLVLFPVS